MLLTAAMARVPVLSRIAVELEEDGERARVRRQTYLVHVVGKRQRPPPAAFPRQALHHGIVALPTERGGRHDIKTDRQTDRKQQGRHMHACDEHAACGQGAAEGRQTEA